MLALWPFDSSPEGWKDVTAGIGSVVTAVALIAGGLWAWWRFRRSPDSWLRFESDVNVTWSEPEADSVVAHISLMNEGGKSARLWWAKQFRTPSDAAADPTQPVDFATWNIDTSPYPDVSRLSWWAATAGQLPIPTGAGLSAEWTGLPRSRCDLGFSVDSQEELRPKDCWTNDILLVLPKGTKALRLETVMWVESHSKLYPFSASRVVLRPESVPPKP